MPSTLIMASNINPDSTRTSLKKAFAKLTVRFFIKNVLIISNPGLPTTALMEADSPESAIALMKAQIDNPLRNKRNEKIEINFALDKTNSPEYNWNAVILRGIPKDCTTENIREFITKHNGTVVRILPPKLINGFLCAVAVLRSFDSCVRFCKEVRKSDNKMLKTLKASIHPMSNKTRNPADGAEFSKLNEYYSKYSLFSKNRAKVDAVKEPVAFSLEQLKGDLKRVMATEARKKTDDSIKSKEAKKPVKQEDDLFLGLTEEQMAYKQGSEFPAIFSEFRTAVEQVIDREVQDFIGMKRKDPFDYHPSVKGPYKRRRK